MIIKENIINEIIINKSRFITYLYKVKNKQEFSYYLDELKRKYKDANHICYAYIIENNQKFSDDKEPTGTAGLPILEVLNKNKLNYIACFVIRYFGGIKLGAGGLIRAYSNSVSLGLKKTQIIPFIKQTKIQLSITYEQKKILENILTTSEILEQDFADKINYILLINEEQKTKLDTLNINYTILD